MRKQSLGIEKSKNTQINRAGVTISVTNLHEQQYHLLLVDDNVAYLELLRLAFVKQPTIHISTTTEATKVIAMLQSGEIIHMVITDYKMPELDGLTLASQLRASGYALPIVLLTSYKDKFLVKQALAVGINLCLEKHRDIFQTYVDNLQSLHAHTFVEDIGI